MPGAAFDENPFKIVFAYDGVGASSLMDHIREFYTENPNIPLARRPNIIHVLGKHFIMRRTAKWQLVESSGVTADAQPAVGEFIRIPGDDVSAIMITIQELHQSAFAFNLIFFKYDAWYDEIVRMVINDPES